MRTVIGKLKYYCKKERHKQEGKKASKSAS